MSAKGNAALPSLWEEFLGKLDAALREEVKIECIGGFVLSLYYGAPRTTGDIDYFSVMPMQCARDLQAMAGPDSALAKKYKVHLQHVTVNSLPEDYEARLVEMFPNRFKKLRLYAPDPYDLALSKLERNSPKDRDDVEYLTRACRLNAEVLRERYEEEMRPYLANESRHDLTLKLWLESCFPEPPPSQ
ncbi:MAG: DUF6036 family nucleotidyltransferase [Terriglobia bacterium]